MIRSKLITIEAMERYCNGKEKLIASVNDDLGSLFEDLRLQNEPDEKARTYFLPKLPNKEIKLVEEKELSYFQTFMESNPDFEKAEMKLSESNSKFVQGECWRRTNIIECTSNPRKRRHSSTE